MVNSRNNYKKHFKQILLLCAVFFLGILSNKYSVFQHLISLNYARQIEDNQISNSFPGIAPTPHGRWNKFRESQDIDFDSDRLKQIKGLGYLQGSHPVPHDRDVIVYDENRAFKGLNFIVSGHEPGAVLTDMSGKILNEWHLGLQPIWKDIYDWYESIKWDPSYTYWSSAFLFENGDVLAIFDGIGLIKLDKNSNLIWANQNGAHHDLFIDESENIGVLTSQENTKTFHDQQVMYIEDFISILSPNGNGIRNISLFQCLRNSSYASLLKARFLPEMLPKPGGVHEIHDVLHCNTLELLDGKFAHICPAFKKGNVLISSRHTHTIAVVDLEQEKVVWALTGLWNHQHHPTFLDNGNMLVFDNNNWAGFSKVIEINPLTQEISWVYEGDTKHPFYTDSCGSADRLPNGNTLIVESDAGRVFEVTPDKTIVWEYINPHRTGKNNELIASLFKVVRLKPNFPLKWLE
ncbi:MAG: hypothetical protein A2161_20280 [Candidatus Schekmanbacteria bacterium RBG_13_48_7]|uniref:Aryl sulfotransferase n=1 Tax=Candidatus Schekmanbacteria bacterium RBG_13_48_7 TaxID=1817878 RepID=A0A1F7RK52_9BACT|nr:MAG: hypothetical protein A2161_20280 [Candidatus Schekmanbacteria bacterium RBG_13_48_7]